MRIKIYNRSLIMLCVGIWLMLISLTTALDRIYDMDRLSTCNQELTLFDEDIILNGRSNAAPANPPTECEVYLKSGYTDGKNRLQVVIESIDIKDCAVYVDVFNGRGAFGVQMRRMGCSSKNTDTLYSDEDQDWITIKFQRPTILYQTAYIFMFRIKSYQDPDVPGILLGGTRLAPGAIIGIVVGLLAIIVLAIILIWCWKSGRMDSYIGLSEPSKDTEKLGGDYEKSPSGGEDNAVNGKMDKLKSQSVNSGIDHRDPAVWNTITSGKYDPNFGKQLDQPQFLGRATYRQNRPRRFDDHIEDDVQVNNNHNVEASVEWRGRDQNGRDDRSRVRGQEGSSKETLIDDVFESDDNKILASRHKRHGADDEANHYIKKGDIEGGSFRRNEPTRGSGGNRGSGRGDNNRGSLRRGEDGSPTRGSLRRGEVGRGSNKSTGSNKEDQTIARTLAEEAAAKKLKSTKPSAEHQAAPSSPIPPPPPPPPIPGEDNTSEDSELREINGRAVPDDSNMMPNPNIQQSKHKDSQKSPSSKKKKKQKQKHQEVEEDRLPPEAFEPLFDRPVSEDPYPEGMQPLNMGYNMYGGPGGMYPMQPYGMPYGMMPAPGMVPPGTQTYAYAYQTAPQPGVAPQQVAGKAAWIVQETPTKDGPVKKTAFMMATAESRPESQQHRDFPQGSPGGPGYSSTPYGDTPQRKGSGRRRPNQHDNHNNTSIVPAGVIPPDNGQGHRTAMMKSGVDPNTGIETNQVLWTDTTRDPSDPPPGANPQITRKTVIRTTTRSGHGELPEAMDDITDHLYLEMEPHDQPFLSPSRSGPHAISAKSTPDRDNLTHYLGLNNRQGHSGSSQHIVHAAPSRNKAIRESVSIA